MATIELKNIHQVYHQGKEKSGFSIDTLNTTWEDGTANALLGPSGCGKTTILNIVSGLLQPTGGQVLIDGEDMTHLPPKDRRIAQVFQFPVVYDSMDVWNNLAFPLKNDGMAPGDITYRVSEISELLDLKPLLKARAGRLNPAQKQLVSLGRGIIRKTTAAVLLDEPLTVIDPKLKWELRRKLKLVQQELGLTMIYVTHDQQEALTFADNVTIMKSGRIEQTGTPDELYSQPASPFIGYFIGSPGMNFLPVQITDTGLDFGTGCIPISDGIRNNLSKSQEDLTVGIRPEALEIAAIDEPGASIFSVTTLEDTGAYHILTLESVKTRIKARVPETFGAEEGELLWFRFPEDKLHFFRNDQRVSAS